MKRHEHFASIALVLESQHEVSKPVEFHLRLLSEPDLSVSTHPAPITPTGDRRPSFQCEKSAGLAPSNTPSQYMALVLRYLNRLCFRRALKYKLPLRAFAESDTLRTCRTVRSS